MKKKRKNNRENKSLLLQAVRQRALVYSLMGHHEEGIEDLRFASQFCRKDKNIDVATTAMYTLNLADFIARNKGEYFHAEKLIKKAFAEIDTRKHHRVYARGLFYLAIISYLQGNYDKALFYSRKALDIYKCKLPERKRSIMEVYSSLGLLHHCKGDLKTSLFHYRKALALAKTTDDKVAISTISNNIGTVYRDKGDFDRAQAHFTIHLSMSKKLGYKRGTGIAMGNIANIYLDKDLPGSAQKLLIETYKIFEDIGYTIGMVLSLGNLALANYRLGKLEEATVLYKKGTMLSKKIGFSMGTGVGLVGLARVSKDINNIEEAETHLKTAKEVIEKTGDKLTLSEIYHHLSTLNVKTGDYEEAQRYAEKSLLLAREAGGKREEIMAFRSSALAFIKCDPKKARAFFIKSIVCAEKNQRKFEQAKSRYEFSNFLIAMGKETEAKDNLSKALNIFREINSKTWLRKAQQLKRTVQ